MSPVARFRSRYGAGLGHLIGIVEGIIYLTKSDDQFVAEYIVGGKEWF